MDRAGLFSFKKDLLSTFRQKALNPRKGVFLDPIMAHFHSKVLMGDLTKVE